MSKQQSCKSTQLNYHKMTGFFCRPIRLKSTQVIWTVDTLKGQLSSSELDGGAFCPTGFCSKSLRGGGNLGDFLRGSYVLQSKISSRRMTKIWSPGKNATGQSPRTKSHWEKALLGKMPQTNECEKLIYIQLSTATDNWH